MARRSGPPNLQIPSVLRFYDAVAARWAEESPVERVVVALGGGPNDILVRTDLTPSVVPCLYPLPSLHSYPPRAHRLLARRVRGADPEQG